jgi:hypothetical protein
MAVEILNGKNVFVAELSLPTAIGTQVTLDNNTNQYIYVDSLSASVGTQVNEHELVGSDMKIFSEGVRNAVINITISLQLTYNAQNWYTILQAIEDYPIYVNDGAYGTGERYYCKLLLKNSAAATVGALAPAALSWASCEVGDVDFPANDKISISLTLRYGKLTWAAS